MTLRLFATPTLALVALVVAACGSPSPSTSSAGSTATTSGSGSSSGSAVAAGSGGDFAATATATGDTVPIPGGTMHLIGSWTRESTSTATRAALADPSTPGANAQVTSVDAGAANAAQLPLIVGQVKSGISGAHAGAAVEDIAGSRVGGSPAQGFTFAYTEKNTAIKGEEIVVIAGGKALILAIGAPADAFAAEVSQFHAMVDSVVLG